MPRASSSMARPSGKLGGTSTRRRPSCFRTSAITSAGGRLPAVLLEGRRDLRPREHAVDVRLLPRPVHLEVAHDEDARLPLLDEEEGVRGEEAGRVEDVGVGLGGGVEESAGGRLLHGGVSLPPPRARRPPRLTHVAAQGAGSGGGASAGDEAGGSADAGGGGAEGGGCRGREGDAGGRGRPRRPRPGRRRARRRTTRGRRAWAWKANIAASSSSRRSRSRTNCSRVTTVAADERSDHQMGSDLES